MAHEGTHLKKLDNQVKDLETQFKNFQSDFLKTQIETQKQIEDNHHELMSLLRTLFPNQLVPEQISPQPPQESLPSYTENLDPLVPKQTQQEETLIFHTHNEVVDTTSAHNDISFGPLLQQPNFMDTVVVQESYSEELRMLYWEVERVELLGGLIYGKDSIAVIESIVSSLLDDQIIQVHQVFDNCFQPKKSIVRLIVVTKKGDVFYCTGVNIEFSEWKGGTMAWTLNLCFIFIAVAALNLPFFMKFLVQSLALKIKLVSYATLLVGFYMSCDIGANNVINVMEISVGLEALSIRQLALIAEALESSGVLSIGTHVTSIKQEEILDPGVFQGKDTILFVDLLPSLVVVGNWLQVTVPNGWMVSIMHHMVESMVGFGLVYRGLGVVLWSLLAKMTTISPIMEFMVSFILYKCIDKVIVMCGMTIKLCGSNGTLSCMASNIVGITIFSSIMERVKDVNYYDIKKNCEGSLCYDFVMLMDWKQNLKAGIYGLICNYWIGNSKWHGNLLYELLCGIDRIMVSHFDVIGMELAFSTALKFLNAQVGKASSLAWLNKAATLLLSQMIKILKK